MIVQVTKEINGVEYMYTYSDSGMKIVRDGVEYDEAIDPIDSNRTYTESETPRAETGAEDMIPVAELQDAYRQGVNSI